MTKATCRAQAAAFCALLLLCAGSASALEDLSGAWGGRVSCDGIDDGNQSRTKEAILVSIDDAGDGTSTLSLDGIDFVGRVETDMARPDTGVLFANSCDFDPAFQVGYVLHAEVRTRAGSPKASLSGTLLFMDGPSGAALRCELKLERFLAGAPPEPIVCTL